MIPLRRLTRTRPAYFRGQLLDEADFRAEQDYYRDAWHLHNKKFHRWGVVDGLEVALDNDGRTVSVAPGLAIDSLGREVLLEETAVLDLSSVDADQTVYVLLAYDEAPGEERQSEYGTGPARILEYSVLSLSTTKGIDGSVTLARLDPRAKAARPVDYGDTPYATSVLAPGWVGYRELADGLRNGWMRLPFKPFPMENEHPFRIGPTEARSTDEGAAGSMAIPVPPGAMWLQRFRIAGETNEGIIKVEFFRCGWDSAKDDHEKTSMLTQEFDAKDSGEVSPKRAASSTPLAFEYTAPLEGRLDPEYHALAIVARATKKASISLIAVEFAFSGGRTAISA